MRYAVLLGLLCLGTPIAPAVAQPNPRNLPKTIVPATTFSTPEEFVRWTENYYRNPRPDMLDEAFRFFLDSELAQDEAKRVELAAFFGAAISRLPAMAPAVRDAALRDGSYDSLFALVNALWLADNEECRDILRDLAENEPNQQVKSFITRRVQSAAPVTLEAPVKSLAEMRMLWARFGATGDPAIVEHIAGVILTQYATSPEATIFQDNAKASIRARRDKPEVVEGLRRAIEKADPSPLRDDAQALLDEMTSREAGPVAP